MLLLNSQRNFNPLILAETEVYISDFAAALNGRKGRLRIASKSFIFEPDATTEPLLRISFKHIDGHKFGAKSFLFQASHTTEIKTGQYGNETRIVSPAVLKKKETTYEVELLFGSIRDLQGLLEEFDLPSNKQTITDTQVVASIVSTFDLSVLNREIPILKREGIWVSQVLPMIRHRGLLQLTKEALYFQPVPNFLQVPVRRIDMEDILHTFKRVVVLQNSGLEIVVKHGEESLYLAFEDSGIRDEVAFLIQKTKQRNTLHTVISGVLSDVKMMTSLWQGGQLSNYHYLDFLNCASGRSINDLAQYPIFPWVLTDYCSLEIDLSDPKVYRDFTKPLGAMNHQRLQSFKHRMVDMPDGEKFLYGTHYSTPAYVLYYLVRAMPECMFRLHGGNFDSWNRLFHSLHQTHKSTQEGSACLMELLPQFFALQQNNSFFTNYLGVTTQDGDLKDVVLPPWANGSIDDFIAIHRQALESEYVSEQLPHWIDLIFGYKQRGQNAMDADNLFHPVCYLKNAEDAETKTFVKRSGMRLDIVETQIEEFGRVPHQLFVDPHPQRIKCPEWQKDYLFSKPWQSQPWFFLLEQKEQIVNILERNLSEEQAHGKSSSKNRDTSTNSAATHDVNMLGSAERANLSATRQPPTTEQLFLQNPSKRASKEPPQHVAEQDKKGFTPIQPMKWNDKNINEICNDEKYCYAACEDGSVKMVNIEYFFKHENTESLEADSFVRTYKVSSVPLKSVRATEKFVLLGGCDNAVTLFNKTSCCVVNASNIHADTPSTLAVYNNTVCSGSIDQMVGVYEIGPTGLTSLTAFDELEEEVTALGFCDENLIIAGSKSGTVAVFDVRDHNGGTTFARNIGNERVVSVGHKRPHEFYCVDELGNFRTYDARTYSETFQLHPGACGNVDQMLHFHGDQLVQIFNKYIPHEHRQSPWKQLLAHGTGLTLFSPVDQAVVRTWTFEDAVKLSNFARSDETLRVEDANFPILLSTSKNLYALRA